MTPHWFQLTDTLCRFRKHDGRMLSNQIDELWDKKAQCDVDIERLSVKCLAAYCNNMMLQRKRDPLCPESLIRVYYDRGQNILAIESIIDVSGAILEEHLASMWTIVQAKVEDVVRLPARALA
ncbi:hypothetical protein GJ744_001186 [Endocarpon pusillum]|uniref:Uncharacterized protein n=1 Tax=Endocarpon pusillum TaxID=364733 RepID=A0A8H7E3H4_9EURO|nr:hypothetical protein GJ744_001186 [Endocarpon pusillum]